MDMNVNKIFGLFGSESKTKDIEIIDLYEHPYYWVVMFNKIMTNHEVFSKKFIMFCNEVDPSLNPKDLEKAGEFFAFERAWYYINKVDLNIPLHKETLDSLANQTIVGNLNRLLLHFQDTEEYEKCSVILKIIKAISL